MIQSDYQFELRHLRYFLILSEELHFKKAAERLYISQPALSRQIQQFEKNIGVRLFNRNNRNVELSHAGNYLNRELVPILNKLENTLMHTRMVQQGEQGIIRIGYVGSAMQNVIPEMLIQFSQKHPGIRFILEEMDNQTQLEMLTKQQLDVGFVRMEEVGPHLLAKPVFEENFSLVLPANHPIDEYNFKGLSILSQEPFILFEKSYSPAYYGKIMSLFDDAGFVPQISHSTVHANTIFRLVENGFGLAIVPSSLKLGYRLNVKFIELTDLPQRAVLYMCRNKDNSNPAVIKLLEMITKLSSDNIEAE